MNGIAEIVQNRQVCSHSGFAKEKLIMSSKILKSMLLSALLVLTVAPLSAGAATYENSHVQANRQGLAPSAVKLKDDLRKLWIDHAIWTRSYIVSALAGLEDQRPVLDRLLRNQQDIGNAIKPYYGEAAGNKLAELLTEHILIAGKIVDAAKSGNQADVEKYNKDWHRNADDIARFLSDANPNWSNKELTDMLYTHLALLSENLAARLKKDWNADIVAFDQGEEHLIKLADVLAEGIVKQFPQKFK
jgi:hypothetical protein